MRPKKQTSSVPGTIVVKMQIPVELHEMMKLIRQARHLREASDVKLTRCYREAVQQYVFDKPQQQMLKEYARAIASNKAPGNSNKAPGNSGKPPVSRLPARV